MQIKIRQFNNRYLINHVKKALLFYAEQLKLSKKDLSNLKLFVKMRSDVGADGYCLKLSKKHYYIAVSDYLSYEQLMLTIAHEFVHVKQYVTGELKSYSKQGKAVDVWRGKMYSDIGYYKQPWELEATEKEGDLYINFLSSCFAEGDLKIDRLVNV